MIRKIKRVSVVRIRDSTYSWLPQPRLGGIEEIGIILTLLSIVSDLIAYSNLTFLIVLPISQKEISS